VFSRCGYGDNPAVQGCIFKSRYEYSINNKAPGLQIRGS
jgi:hypothetical protein